MLGLVLKDIYNLKSYSKTIALLLAFFVLVNMMTDNAAPLISGMCTMLFMMMTVYSFSYDWYAKWDRYAQSLPITKQEIVLSKYLLSILLCFSGSALSLVLTVILLKIRPAAGYDIKAQLMASGLSLCVAFLLLSILLPFIFKFGVEKSRIILVVIFAVIFGSAGVLQSIGIPKPTEASLLMMGKLFPIAAILLYILSYFLSAQIYLKKEL